MATFTYNSKTQQQSVDYANRVVAFKVDPSNHSGSSLVYLTETISDPNGNFTLTWQDWDGRVIVGAIDEDGVLQKLDCIFYDYQLGELVSTLTLSYESHILTQSPFVYYKLGEYDPTTNSSLVDSSGNNRNGSYNIVPVNTQSIVSNTTNMAKLFNSSTLMNSWGGIGSDNLQIKTVECWVNFTDVTGDQIFVKEGGIINGWAIGLVNGVLTIGISRSSVVYTASFNAALEVGITYHVSGVINNSSNTILLYLNGDLVATNTNGSIGAHNGGDQFIIGNCWDVPNQYYTNPITGAQGSAPMLGTLDEITIYNYQLTTRQLMSNYQIGSMTLGNSVDSSAIIHHYELNESQLPIFDITPTAFNLTESLGTPLLGYPSLKQSSGSSMYVPDGTSATVYSPSVDLSLVGLNRIGISVWVKLDPVTTSDPFRTITSDTISGDSSSTLNYLAVVHFNNDASALYWQYEYGTGTDAVIIYTLPVPINDGLPHHIFVGHDYIRLLGVLYVDGVLVSVQPLPSAPTGGNNTGKRLSIGNSSVFQTRTLAGSIQQLVITNNVLDYSQINYIYNNGVGRTVDEFYTFPTDYTAWYDFNDLTGLTVNDRKESYNGTLTNQTIRSSGRLDKGIHGDSVNYITLDSTENLFNITNAVTINCWVYRDDASTIRILHLNHRSGASDTFNYGLGFSVTSTGNVEFRVRQQLDDSTYGTSRGYYTTTASVNLNEWTFISMQVTTTISHFYMYSPTNVVYENVPLGGTYPLTFWWAGAGNYIFARTVSENGEINGISTSGYIDDLSIYTRVLSKSELDILYNKGIGSLIPTTPTNTPALLTEAFDRTVGDYFAGVSISEDGNVLAVGAVYKDLTYVNQGQVYTYDWNESSQNWVFRNVVLRAGADGNSSNINFGSFTSLNQDGSILAVGYPEYGTPSIGAVVVYDWNGSSWVERSIITANSPQTSDKFGFGVDLSDDGSVLVTGAALNDTGGTNRGVVYTFDWNGSSWVERVQLLQAFDATDGDHFGGDLAISGDGLVLAIRSSNWTGTISLEACIYVYDNVAGTWIYRNRITNPIPETEATRFGYMELSTDGSLIICSSKNSTVDNLPQAGALFVLQSNELDWQLIRTITADVPHKGQQLGLCIAYSDTKKRLVVGAADNGNFNEQSDITGAVYTFDLSTTYKQRVLMDGPLLACFFDEQPGDTQLIDYSGNGYHGTFSGGVSLNQEPIFDDREESAYFDGVNDEVNFPIIPALQILDDLYIEIRLRYLRGLFQEIVCMESANTADSDAENNALYKLSITGTGSLQYFSEHGLGINSSVVSVGSLVQGQSYTIGMLRRSDDLELDFYVDGVLFHTSSYNSNPSNGSLARLTLMSDFSNDGLSDNANVYVDSISIYDKLLTPARIYKRARS